MRKTLSTNIERKIERGGTRGDRKLFQNGTYIAIVNERVRMVGVDDEIFEIKF